ncbi:uncharacterized protein BXZ73DRAFT_104602 [Epithele typhae]|uniref:uncharacterized protein n=1 Tax=Epithele typhae TaxID=378194 RepID=UPI0020073153|nr:uncharacterized protein BXZ73DRAFT_104602 [Epithele typhae]KAH9920868.1 hypothetical protein BXZ73DRAFT_104602 [Epithele typhae]
MSALHSAALTFPRMSAPTIWESSSAAPQFPAAPLPPRASRNLKQSRSTENLSHRKDRVDFLRSRESTRRASTGGDLPSTPSRHTRTYSWEDIIAAADAAASASPFVGRPDTIDEAEESDDEPYVIYTATPRAPAPRASPAPFAYPTPALPHTLGTVIYSTSPASSPSPSPSPTLSPAPARERDVPPMIGIGGPYFNGRRSSLRGPHSRHSSLSSISEEDEGLARC